MLTKINRNAIERINENQGNRGRSCRREWDLVTQVEMKEFISILLLAGLVE